MEKAEPSQNNFQLRIPKIDDGEDVYQLIKSCPPLDLNTIYYYYIMCRDFGKTSIVAEINNKTVGYISAFKREDEKSTLFVWQVAVAKEARGLGLAKKMLKEIIKNQNSSINRVETTISPSNKASIALFTSLARDYSRPLEKTSFLKEEDFGQGEHESEDLYYFYIKDNLGKQ